MTGANGKPRKLALLGMPGYQGLTPAAARGFYRAAAGRDFDVRLSAHSSSLLAHNMNILWAWALNTSRAEPVAYFAMQHSDIEPDEFWLDQLVAEMEAHDLDVLGVAVPIKDSRGVTSTALARDDGNSWRAHARLTMRELYRLPATFTSADVGRPLLLNTGLWVCRFDEAWARNVHFEINDRLVWNTALSAYIPEVEPEDWYFSRLLHEQGLRVGCTRVVRVGHRGTMAFGNTRPWGENEFDKEYLTESVLTGTAHDASWFPADVPGWLTEAEGLELARLAAGKVVLEVGSYCGRSTICLARTARSVGAVDPFDGRGTGTPGDTEAAFRAALERHGATGRVNVLKGLSADVLPTLPAVFDLVFIDAAHDRESVASDIALALGCLAPGGLLAFHDYGSPRDPGVTEAVNELVAGGAELLARTESLAVVQPKAETLIPVGS